MNISNENEETISGNNLIQTLLRVIWLGEFYLLVPVQTQAAKDKVRSRLSSISCLGKVK